jgi:chromate reductase, NAD(P)H dehydrogenase (quinone)
MKGNEFFKTMSLRKGTHLFRAEGAMTMINSINVLGFAGSLRKASYNAAVLRTAKELLPKGMSLQIFNIAWIPPYNSDVEAAGLPEPVRQFKTAIIAADALLIATPEYNRSIPGVLKNAIDWASRPYLHSPLNGKPVAIISVTTGNSGARNAQLHLLEVCAAINMPILDEPQVFIRQATEKFSADGHLTDAATCRRIGTLLEALTAWTSRSWMY